MTEQDDELDDNALSDIYTQFSREEPSTELDDRILSEAAKAAGSDKAAAKKLRGPFSGQWMVPASLAAVIVLSVIVVVTLETKHFDSLTSTPEPKFVQAEPPPATDRHDTPSADDALASQEESTAKTASKAAPLSEQHAPAKLKAAPRLREKKRESADIVQKSRVAPQRLAKPAPSAKQRKQPASPASGSSAPQASAGIPGTNTASNPPSEVKEQIPPVVARRTVRQNVANAKQEANEKKKTAPVLGSGLSASGPILASPAPEALRKRQFASEQTPAESQAMAPASAPTAAASDTKSVAKAGGGQALEDVPVAAAAPMGPEAAPAEDVEIAQARSGAQAGPQGETDYSAATSSATTIAQADGTDQAPHESVTKTDQAAPSESAALATVQARSEPKLTKGEETSSKSSAGLASETTEDQEAQPSSTATAFAAAPPGSGEQMQSLTARDAQTPCERFSEPACYVSARCTLQWRKEQKAYICRDADNVCEQGFSQADNNRQDCENNSACVYVPANCYCPPNTKCECEGGPPAMCATKTQP